MSAAGPAPEQLAQVQRAWELDGAATFLRRVENFVYEVRRGEERLVARLTEPAHRTRDEIDAELDWIDFLGSEGMGVARPVRAQSGRFVEELPGTMPLIASVFRWAPGGPLSVPDSFTSEIMETWGRTIGRMNALTRRYRPRAGVAPRRQWQDDDGMRVARRGAGLGDAAARDAFEAVVSELAGWPRPPGAFGLVHGDLHHGNFFVDEGRITAFDFDDCSHHWFVYDLVVPLFAAVDAFRRQGLPGPDAPLRAAYLRGYLAEHPLDPSWIERAGACVRFRAGLLYHWTGARIAEGLIAPELHRVMEASRTWWRAQLLGAPATLFEDLGN